MKKLKEEHGEFTLNGTLILLLVFLLLALAVSVFGVINRSMKLHTMATEVLRYTEVRGQVDGAVDAELARLEQVTGMDVEYTVDAEYLSGSTRVQFGHGITIRLEYPASFGVGGVVKVPITLRTTVTGRSERYWK